MERIHDVRVRDALAERERIVRAERAARKGPLALAEDVPAVARRRRRQDVRPRTADASA
jgi:hypothetical protein